MASLCSGEAPLQQQQAQQPHFPSGAARRVANDECGVVWFGMVPPDRFFELTQLLLSLDNVRQLDPELRNSRDVSFFEDGPFAGQGFVCLHTIADAEALVRRFPVTMLVGQGARFSIRLRLSSLAELKLAQANHEAHYVVGSSPPPPPPPPRRATSSSCKPMIEKEADGRESLVYLLRGLPYEATAADLEAFVESLRGKCRRVEMGVFSTGECSGNAFAELDDAADRDAMNELHYANFPVAANTTLPPLARPKPRFIEVISITTERRTQMLAQDANAQRGSTAQPRRVRGLPASSSAAAAAAAAAVGRDAATAASVPTTTAATSLQGGTPLSRTAKTRALVVGPPSPQRALWPPQHPYRQRHSQPQQQQQQMVSRYAAPSQFFPPLQRNTMTFFSPPASSAMAAAQPDFSLALANTTQLPTQFEHVLPLHHQQWQQQQQLQQVQQQQLQQGRVYLLHEAPFNPQSFLVHPNSYVDCAVPMQINRPSTISLVPVNVTLGYLNGHAQLQHLAVQQQQQQQQHYISFRQEEESPELFLFSFPRFP